MSPDQKEQSIKLSEDLIELLLSRTADNGIAIPALMSTLAWYIAKDMLITNHSLPNYIGMVASYLHNHLDDYKDKLAPHRDQHSTLQ